MSPRPASRPSNAAQPAGASLGTTPPRGPRPASRPTALGALALGALALWGLGAGGCVTRSTFLRQVDETVRLRSRLEACDQQVERMTGFRATLETDLKASERRTAVCLLEKKAVTATAEVKTKSENELQAEVGRLRASNTRIADDMNELRARHATADETIRGLRSQLEDQRRDQRRARDPDLTDVRRALKAEVDESNGLLSLQQARGAVLLRIAHSQLFRQRRPALSPEGKDLLARLADALRRLRRRSVLVVGHQDASPPPRTLGSVVDLSHYQAAAVARQLIRSGLAPARVTCQGLGASRPAAAAGDPEQNRRVELVIRALPPPAKLEVITPDAPRDGT